MRLQCVEYILSATTLCKLTVAVIANYLDGAFHIGLVGYESLTEGVLLACSLQDLSLEE